MNIQISVAIIAFMSVIISALVSVLVTHFSLARKLDVQVQINYSTALIERRHSAYPHLYQHLSDFVKTLRFGMVTKEYLHSLRNDIEKWDSAYAILIGSRTQKALYMFRQLLIEDLLKRDEEWFAADKNNKELRYRIGELENLLRSELGVYIVEYSDSRKKHVPFVKEMIDQGLTKA